MRQFWIKLKLEMLAFEAVNPAGVPGEKPLRTKGMQEQKTEQTHPTRGIEARGHIDKRSVFVSLQ